MKKITLFTVFLLITSFTAAETNEIPLITVTASAQTAETAAIHDVLRAEPGVALNSQGGSQNDLSVRGSTFSGTGLSLGGLTLRNPQTEHFHAELPLPAAMLSRPDVRTGLQNRGGHLVGTVGFDLLPITGKKQVEIGSGSDHQNGQSLLVQQRLSGTLGIGVFAGRESAEGVDYPDNDYDRETIGTHLQHHENDTQVDLIIAHQEKEFGARGYYGADPSWGPPSEETEDTLLLLSALHGNLNTDYLRAGLSWREFDDYYSVPDKTYWNRHRSRTSSVFTDGRTLEINGWALGWRADIEEERTASTGHAAWDPAANGLGFHHRTRGGISLLPQWRGDRLKITGGARGEFFTDQSAEYLPQLGAEYMLSDNLTAFASYSESVRLPSYTELNYDSLYVTGNSDLNAQTSQQIEMGLKGLPSETIDWKMSLFHRRSHDTIDRLYTSPTSGIHTNLGTIRTFGAEAQVGWYPAQNLELQLIYTWLHKDQEAADFDAYASRYVLDYPEHHVQASLLWRPFRALEIGTVQALRIQTDNKVRKNGDVGTDSSFVVRYTPPNADYATLSLLANNAWDDDFQPFPGQRPSERFVGMSLTLNW